MKRFLAFLGVLLLSTLLFASVSFGYSVAPYGESGEENYLGLEARGIVSFTSFHHYGDLSLCLKLGTGADTFKGLGAMVSSPLLATTHHPFGRWFNNTVLWEPTVGVGVEWDGEGPRAKAMVSPLAFASATYLYEVMSPFVFTSDFSSYGWGITVLRVSPFPGGAR